MRLRLPSDSYQKELLEKYLDEDYLLGHLVVELDKEEYDKGIEVGVRANPE